MPIDDWDNYLFAMESGLDGYAIKMDALKLDCEKRTGKPFDEDLFENIRRNCHPKSWVSQINGERWYVKNRKQRQAAVEDWQLLVRLVVNMDQFPITGIPLDELKRRLRRFDWGRVSNVAEQMGIYLDDDDHCKYGIGIPRIGRTFRWPFIRMVELLEEGAIGSRAEFDLMILMEGFQPPAGVILWEALQIEESGNSLLWRMLDEELQNGKLTGQRYTSG